MNPDQYKYNYQHYYDDEHITIDEMLIDEPLNEYESPEIFFRETILEKLDSLKNRIDDTFNLMIEDNDFYPSKQIFKKMNVLWKKYK